MVCGRSRFTNSHGNSIFHHMLETDDTTAAEEVQDRNFRDLQAEVLDQAGYLRLLNEWQISIIHPGRFIIGNHLDYLPEVDNVREETMFGAHPLHYYRSSPVSLYNYSWRQLFSGLHHILLYAPRLHNTFLSDMWTFIRYRYLFASEEDLPSSDDDEMVGQGSLVDQLFLYSDGSDNEYVPEGSVGENMMEQVEELTDSE